MKIKIIEAINKSENAIMALNIAHSVKMLLILDFIGKETTTSEINKRLARDLRISLSGGSLNNTLASLVKEGFATFREEIKKDGKVLRRYYSLTENGKKLVYALYKFLEALE